MTAKQNLKYQLLAARCGFAFEILYTIFCGYFGHNLPPASPNLSAQDLASILSQHHNAILFGNCMAALVGILWVPWTAQLTVVMWRIEGSNPVLTGHASRQGTFLRNHHKSRGVASIEFPSPILVPVTSCRES